MTSIVTSPKNSSQKQSSMMKERMKTSKSVGKIKSNFSPKKGEDNEAELEEKKQIRIRIKREPKLKIEPMILSKSPYLTWAWRSSEHESFVKRMLFMV